MPRDPQGAETRTETRVEWRNVYANGARLPAMGYASRADADKYAEAWFSPTKPVPRIAVERIETTTTITQYPIPPHAGEETKG